jgi:hypothetical protein
MDAKAKRVGGLREHAAKLAAADDAYCGIWAKWFV